MQPVAGQLNAATTAIAQAGVDTATVMTPAATAAATGAFKFPSLAMIAAGGLASLLVSHDGAGAVLQTGDLWEIRDTAGAGLHGGFGQRTSLFSAAGLELRGLTGAAGGPAFVASAAGDAHVLVPITSTTAHGLLISGASGAAGDLIRAVSASGSNVYFRITAAGHIGIATATANTGNPLVAIGAGGGSLTDNGAMGLKIKVDTTTSAGVDGIQSNVNVIAGTNSSASVRAITTRIDIRDATGTGDTVVDWTDAQLLVPNCKRNLWAANKYLVLGSLGSTAANQFIYTGTGVGMELGLANFCVNPGDGSTIAFGGTISSASPNTITGVSIIGGYVNGAPISGSGIPSGTTIVSGAGTATLTISNNATVFGALLLTVSAQANIGCALHLVAAGTNPIRASILLGTLKNNVQWSVLAPDDTDTGNGYPFAGPSHGLIYYGALAAQNMPTGRTPRFMVDPYGWIGGGMYPADSPVYNGTFGVPAARGGLAIAAPGYFGSTLTVAGATQLGALSVTGPAVGLDQFFTHRSYGQVATLPYLLGTTAVSAASGQLYAAMIYPKQAITSSSVQFMTGSTTPSGLTACYIGVYKADGTLLAQSDNMASAVTAANQLVTATFSGGAFALAASTVYYLAVVFVGTTTPGLGGTNVRASALANKTLPNAGNAPALTKTASGYSSGTLPSLTTAGTNVVPYIEVL